MLKIVLSLVVWLAAPSAAFACLFVAVPDFEIDDTIEDSEPPAAAVVKEVRPTRGKGPQRENGRVVGWNSCDDIGFITIALDTDDPDVGYFLARVDGNLPHGFELPESPRLAQRSSLFLHWIDGWRDNQDAFGFTLKITSMDRAGNLGEPVEIFIEDDGIP